MSVESISLVLNHSRMKGTAKVVLIGIANHDGDGGSWPSIATLARYANVTPRNVQKAISDIVAAGEVVVHAQDGGTRQTPADRRPNRYTITVRPVNHGVSDATPRSDSGASDATERGGGGDTRGASEATPEPSLNHPEPSSTSSPAAPTTARGATDEDFATFWATYPRREGKAAAAKAFTKAAKAIGAEAVLAGAFRFANDPNLPAKRFVPHPATWLNQGRWDDEPLPDRAVSGRTTTDDRVAEAMRVAQRFDNADGRHLRAIGGSA